MSLRIWLPMNRDLRNQGLDDVTVTNNGATFNSAGKLGGCYPCQFTIPNSSIINNLITYLDSGGDFSVAFWFKYTTANTGEFIKCGDSSATGSRLHFAVNNNVLRFGFRSSDYDGPTLVTNTWYHVVCSYSNSKKYIYLNGNLHGTANSGKLAIPQNNAILFTSSSVYLNDFRLYDHCLSPMEVKELSKGLVLHYPLNRQGWGQENLVWNSNWNVHSTTPPESWVNWGSPPTREIVTIDGKNWLHVISNTTQFQGYSQNWTKRNGVGELTANTKMTVSFTAKLATAASIAPIGIHWCNSSGTIVTQNWATVALTTSPKRYHFTYTTPSNCVAFNIMVGDNTNTAHEIWITDIKLELGEIATPWCPNSSDALATTMGLNGTTEYDTSGFCNNGTKVGILGWSSNTPKYNVSLDITTDSCARYIYGPAQTQLTDQITLACWLYQTSATATSGGNSTTDQFALSQGRDYLNFGFNIIVNNGKPGVYAGNGGSESGARVRLISTTKTITGSWHHVAATYNNGALKLYVDGQLDRETTIGTLDYVDAPALVIGKMAYGYTETTSYFPFRGYISDVRVYATALSADDVLDLYNNTYTVN